MLVQVKLWWWRFSVMRAFTVSLWLCTKVLNPSGIMTANAQLLLGMIMILRGILPDVRMGSGGPYPAVTNTISGTVSGVTSG